jgi:hypothetical protein
LVFSNTNNQIFDTEQQKLAFQRYIQAGGGFVSIHSACGSEREWREVVNKIQFMRRKAGFSITDRIHVFVEGTDRLRDAIERHGPLIRDETQADGLEFGAGEGEAREEWNINGEPAVLTVRRT